MVGRRGVGGLLAACMGRWHARNGTHPDRRILLARLESRIVPYRQRREWARSAKPPSLRSTSTPRTSWMG